MNPQEAERERQRQIEQSQDVPDHVKDGKTLPEQVEGDHAYRDEYPEAGLWATCKIHCLVCGTRYPDAPGGEVAERLRDGQIDVRFCTVCDRNTPCVDPSRVQDTIDDMRDGYQHGFIPEVRAYAEGRFHGFMEALGINVNNIAVLKGEAEVWGGESNDSENPFADAEPSEEPRSEQIREMFLGEENDS